MIFKNLDVLHYYQCWAVLVSSIDNGEYGTEKFMLKAMVTEEFAWRSECNKIYILQNSLKNLGDYLPLESVNIQ